MKVRRYTVAEAQEHFETLLLEAEQGDGVYIIDEKKQMVKLVPIRGDKASAKLPRQKGSAV